MNNFRVTWPIDDPDRTPRDLVAEAIAELPAHAEAAGLILTGRAVFTITFTPGERPKLTAEAPARVLGAATRRDAA